MPTPSLTVSEDRVSEKTSIALCNCIILMAALAPVFCPGCTGPVSAFPEEADTVQVATRVSLAAAGVVPSGIRCLDLFFFNDDQLQRLDAYQRIEGSALTAAVGASRSGKKILAVLANSNADRYRWADVNSLQGLAARTARLQEEDPSHPLGQALLRIDAGRSVTVSLAPLSARIRLASISCDFKDRPYAGAKLEDVRVYLTHVNTSSPLLADSVRVPTDFINAGRLKETDLEGFLYPGIVQARLPAPVGVGVQYPGIDLYCYPNAPDDRGPGTPSTRLVIEGTLLGTTCYYPLEIGLENGRAGVLGNRTYQYDITLTRRGASDPDTPLQPGAMQTRLEVLPWKEPDPLVIPF